MSKIYIELEKAVAECKEIADEYGNSKRISDRQTCAGINTAIRVFENIPAADVIERKQYDELLRAARKMHTWIFLNTADEENVYEECGLSEEMNVLLGYL